MAPRALTLKYRPQVFADLVGQEHVTSVLSAALTSGRVAQGYLFTGARGVGKTTSARILAKALNCENRGKAKGKGKAAAADAAEPCNECTSCVAVTAGNSLDVLEIDGASNRGVADVQALREWVRFAPAGGRYRVVIIDEVHQLSGDAFAALLKTLEEPPPHLVFLFATTDPQKLPDTIRSRTQRFDFARVAIRRVADRLLEIQKREAADADGAKFKLTDGAALLIAHKGEGSMRDAVSALDQVVSAGEESIDEPLVRRVLGIADREAYFGIAGAVLGRDPQATLQHLHDAFHKGFDAKELAEGLAEHFRDVLVLKVDPARATDMVAASAEDIERLKAQGEGWADSDLLRLMRLAAECQLPMRDSPQPMVHLEAAVLQMATLEPAESVAALLERLEQIEQRLGGGSVSAVGGAAPRAAAPSAGRAHGFLAPSAPPAPARAATPVRSAPAAPRFEPAPAAPARPSATTPGFAPSRPAPTPTTGDHGVLDDAIVADWRAVVKSLAERKRMLGAFLEESTLRGVSDTRLVLEMDDLHRAVIDTSEHRALIQTELASRFGRALELVCIGGAAAPVRPIAQRIQDLQPMIDRAIEVFEGEVIERPTRPGDRSR